MINARVAVLAIPLLLVACSTAGGPTPAGPTPAGPTPAGPTTPVAPPTVGTPVSTPLPTQGPTEPAASPAASTPAATLAPGPPDLGDLEALIPTEVAGNEMTIEPASDPARSFMILWNDEQVAQDLLDTLGASSSDIDVVFSYPSEATHPNRVSVDGYRVAGSDGTALRDGMVENYREYLGAHTAVEVTEETVAGKEVLMLATPEASPGQGQYFYGVGDIVFVVSGQPSEWVEDALAQLP